MKNNIKTNSIVLLASILILMLLLNTCRLTKKVDDRDKQITAEQLAKQRLDSIISTKDQVIYRQEAIITSNQQAINELTDSVFSLKKKDTKNRETIAYYKGTTKTVLRDVLVPYLDSVKLKQFSDSMQMYCQEVLDYIQDSSVRVGTIAEDITPYYSIKQTVEKDGIKINSLSIPDTLNLRFVNHKGGLFRRSKIEVQYFHSNPFIKSTSSSSVFYKPKKKSNLLPKALLIAAGIFVGTRL